MQVAIFTDKDVFICEDTESSNVYLWQGKFPMRVSGGKLYTLNIKTHESIVDLGVVTGMKSAIRTSKPKTVVEVTHLEVGVTKAPNGSYTFGSVAVRTVEVR